MKFSPWFSCDNPPVRSGYYDVHDCITGYIRRMYYDTEKREWKQFSNSVEQVVFVFRDRWRGMMNGGKE